MVEHKVALLSVVGSLVSLRDESFVSCQMEAHPGGATAFVALQLLGETGEFLERPKRRRLDQVFSSSQVFAVLRKDPLLQTRDPAYAPASLAQLLKLAGSFSVFFDKEADLCYSVPHDFLTRFAFHHVEEDRVAVRVGLPGAGPCRYNLTQMGLLLPAPSSLAAALSAAAARQEGFLMADAATISKGRLTSLTFGRAQHPP
jgi:hypothetical protein